MDNALIPKEVKRYPISQFIILLGPVVGVLLLGVFDFPVMRALSLCSRRKASSTAGRGLVCVAWAAHSGLISYFSSNPTFFSAASS